MDIGGKAKSLTKLKELGLNVPNFIIFQKITENWESFVLQKITKLNGDYFAVRSSANLEDGKNLSFAGLFETKLFVNRAEVHKAILSIFDSINHEHVKAYLKINSLAFDSLKMNVIVQEMIPAEVSGVAFSKNPLKAHKNEQIISAVYGLGEGLVSGKLDADQYLKQNNGAWIKNIAKKTSHLKFNDNKLVYLPLNETKHEKACLNDVELNEISIVLKKLEKHFSCPQDLEFCYVENQLYILQSRPITNLKEIKSHVIWDNSNIIESYPGITLPFTFSFILKIYSSVYQNFAQILGVPKNQIQANQEVFDEMLGHINGRVYYHLIHWYKALALLPAYQINKDYMEKMMGVKEPLGIEFQLKKKPQKWIAYLHLIKTLFKLIYINRTLKKKKAKFTKRVQIEINKFKHKNYSDTSIQEIWKDYLTFKSILVKEWTPPLANDFLAMIYFGLLAKLCKNWLHDEQLHTELIKGKFQMISVEPALLLNKIIVCAEKENLLKKINQLDENTIWDLCINKQFQETGKLICSYIDTYGDRSVGELKLENDTFTQNPASFIRILKSYEKSSNINFFSSIEEKKPIINLPFFKQKVFNYILNKAAETVSDRENLRFDRTKAFGIIRKFINEVGLKLYDQGKIENQKDIFYLNEFELEEVFMNKFKDLKETISSRKYQYDSYKTENVLPNRIHEVNGELIIEKESDDEIGDLSGIPCCSGEVSEKVVVLSDANDVKSLNGAILVTESTDPGWITIFQSASGILVERGSTLSHAAIVSRELGIPCIVGIKGLCKTLKTGERITMNGKTGKIIRHDQ